MIETEARIRVRLQLGLPVNHQRRNHGDPYRNDRGSFWIPLKFGFICKRNAILVKAELRETADQSGVYENYPSKPRTSQAPI